MPSLIVTEQDIYDCQFEIFQHLESLIPQDIPYQKKFGTLSSNQNIKITQPNVMIGHVDILDFKVEFNGLSTEPTVWNGVQYYIKLAEDHPETNFVLLMGLENTDIEIHGHNIQLVRLGTGMLNQRKTYQSMSPHDTKNFDSNKVYICLNRNNRPHRINLVSYLLGSGFGDFGIISFKDHGPKDHWLERVDWEIGAHQEHTIKPVLIQGYNLTKSMYLGESIEQLNRLFYSALEHITSRNSKNFDVLLRNLYENVFVEIVSETIFDKKYFGLSEKFLNSVYGCVFPIMIAGPGAIKFLDQLGFDMFHDIIDHSYDTISNPLDRLCSAIDLNSKLLTDSDYVKFLWKENQQRFINNVTFAKTQMYDWHIQRAVEDFKKISWNKS